MSSVGIGLRGEGLIVGWPHVVQCMDICLRYANGSFVWRRDWNQAITSLLDKPQNESLIIDFIYKVSDALRPRIVRGTWYGEPRFHLLKVNIDPSIPAKVSFSIDGIYFPRGHLNDFRNAEHSSAVSTIVRTAAGAEIAPLTSRV